MYIVERGPFPAHRLSCLKRLIIFVIFNIQIIFIASFQMILRNNTNHETRRISGRNTDRKQSVRADTSRRRRKFLQAFYFKILLRNQADFYAITQSVDGPSTLLLIDLRVGCMKALRPEQTRATVGDGGQRTDKPERRPSLFSLSFLSSPTFFQDFGKVIWR